MKLQILVALVLLPALIVSMTVPAHALFGLGADEVVQNVIMLANQATQIANAQFAKLTMNGQLTELTDQFAHLQDQALGAVGEITDPFTTMASRPTRMIGAALTWKTAFTGSAARIANGIEAMAAGTSLTQTWQGRLSAADTVTETQVLNLFTPLGTERSAAATEAYRAGREQADERLVLNFATSDAATELLRAAAESATAYRTWPRTRTSPIRLCGNSWWPHASPGAISRPGSRSRWPSRRRVRARCGDDGSRDRAPGSARPLGGGPASRPTEVQRASGRDRGAPGLHARGPGVATLEPLRRTVKGG